MTKNLRILGTTKIFVNMKGRETLLTGFGCIILDCESMGVMTFRLKINYTCKTRNWAQGYSHKNAGSSISSVFTAGIAISMSSAEKGMLHQKYNNETKD